MNDTPKFMTHERIMQGEEYVSYSDYLVLQRERDEAQETADKWRKLHDAKDELFKKGIAEIERELDEAREEWGKASMDAAQLLSEKTKVMAERDEARENLRILASLVVYGLGQSGEEWALDAMRQAIAAIQKAKVLEGVK